MEENYQQLIEFISENSGVSTEDIERKIEAKQAKLSGLISKEGAAHIVANELGIKLMDSFSGKLQIKKMAL